MHNTAGMGVTECCEKYDPPSYAGQEQVKVLNFDLSHSPLHFPLFCCVFAYKALKLQDFRIMTLYML